ncbi:MAG: hypothetical protein JNK11_03500 [Alphaproteobacteria bacterium]|nr:hypothetical protein [Alphaproteobacteria bacterium]
MAGGDEAGGVVIVHDDAAWRNRLAQQLRALGIPCGAYGSDQATLRMLRDTSPGVLLVGVSMTGRDSIDLLRDVRTLDTPPAILLVQTGVWQIAEIARSCAAALGLTDVVVLPPARSAAGDDAMLGTALGMFATWRYRRFADAIDQSVAC